MATWVWIAFILFIVALLALDLGVFHRNPHVIKVREALNWSAFWLALGLSFSIFVYFAYAGNWQGLGTSPDPVDGMVNDGMTAVEKYLLGFVVEWSLSVDNIFVISAILGYFAVPPMYQHRVLFWGILGALVMRGLMIAVGARLIAEFHWILYVFAVFLLFTGARMLMIRPEKGDPGNTVVLRLVRRLFPVTTRFHEMHFLVRAGEGDGPRPGVLVLTPLALALVAVETTDLIFAVDSIPAIFAVTGDPFLVFTSNVFAILGLRSMYFALADLVRKFRYLKVSLAFMLILVGIKMLAGEKLREALGGHMNLWLLLAVVAILAAGVLASLVSDGRRRRALREKEA